jgi:menaquinol-cytochrome c reductase iron-sulfur subunit
MPTNRPGGADAAAGDGSAGSDRRGFLTRFAAIACGGLATLPALVAGVWTTLDPLRRTAGAGSFLRVTDLSSVPDDGMPRRFPVISDRVDAWTGFASEPIGAVYLRRTAGSDTVEAFTAICPHAGCFVQIDTTEKCFRCPCHNSRFALDGSIVPPSPSPRAMDTLECQVAADGGVSVKWQTFRTGFAEKKARS